MKKVLTCIAMCTILSPGVSSADALVYSRIALGIDIAGEEQSIENSSSRFGIRGSRDLGRGNSIIGRYEFGVDGSSANLSPDDANRLSYIGFKGRWGEVQVGSVWSAYFNKVGALGCDPFTLGCFSEMTLRLPDSIGYSGIFNGVGVEATASFGESDANEAGGDAQDDGIAQTQLALSYDIAGFGLSIGFDSNDKTGAKYSRTGVAIQYDIADVGFKALLTSTDQDAGSDIDEIAFTVSSGAGPHSVTAELWISEQDNADDDGTMLGYLYKGIPKVQLGLAYQTQDSVEDDRVRLYLRHDF